MSGGSEPGYVCLGASAGGLRSLEAIVSRIPSDFPWPILVSQHLQADRVSQMAEILARTARTTVREAAEGETPRAGTVYTCPSAQEMGVTMEGTISLRAPAPGKPQRIDHLFATASYARPGRTIAVVLSGTGADGAVGALVVKLNHGTVIAESAESAQHGAMPAATQRAVTVDAVRAADAIADLLGQLTRGDLEQATAAATATVARIARAITRTGETDFTHYRPGTLRRQAERRRAILRIDTLDEYEERLAADPAERDALVKSLLIPVTEFFRDPAAWRAVEDDVVPMLSQRAREGRSVRVWCAGCASGEEAYTIAILLAESIVDRRRVQIVGTDLDPGAIAAAARGAFDASRMTGVDAMRRERFFRTEGHDLVANDDLRTMVRFAVHDVTRDEPPGQFDLIICRNVLIYFDEALQAHIFGKLHGALVGPRILFLGRSEAVPTQRRDFAALARPSRIFRAVGKGPSDRDAAGVAREPRDVFPHAAWSGSADARIEDPDALIFIIDGSWTILNANAYACELMEGDLAGTPLLDAFPRWQGSPVHDALRAHAATGRSLKVRGVPTPDGRMDVTLEAIPGGAGESLVIATPTPSRARARPDPEGREARKDLAAVNDELQASNEELAAANEELQATNEELASVNEEFQSTNQALASTNVELDEVAKNARLSADLVNEFIQAWEDPLIACDLDRRLTLFNRRAGVLFGLDATSLCQPLHRAGVDVPDAALDAARVSATNPDHGVTVTSPRGALRVRVEYVRAADGRPLGWVLTWSPA